MFTIDCISCYKILYVEFINSFEDEHAVSLTYYDYYLHNNEYYCMGCLMFCKRCNISIIEKNNDTHDYCLECYKKFLIKNTYNDITKKLPVELIDIILSFYFI